MMLSSGEGATCLRRVGQNEANSDFTQLVHIFTTQAMGLTDYFAGLPVIQR
jgi:hypothetical protein